MGRRAPLLVPAVLILVFACFHIWQNRKAESEFQRWAATNKDRHLPMVAVVFDDEAKKSYAYNIEEGRAVADTFYYRSQDGVITRVTPTDMVTIKGPVAWRLFVAGVRCSDAETWFTDHILNPHRAMDGPRARAGIRLDPTNPTPFSMILLGFLGSLVWRRRGKAS